MNLAIHQATYRLNTDQHFKIEHLTLSAGQYSVIIGQNGSGKSAIAAAIAGRLDKLEGESNTSFERIEFISFEQIQHFLEKEWRRDNTDLLGPDEEGRTAKEVILAGRRPSDAVQLERWIDLFGIDDLKDRPFKLLSTGEMRKVFLCRSLLADPQLLILDEPFEGLDVDSREHVKAILAKLNQDGMTIVLILNRFADLPIEADKLGVVVELQLTVWVDAKTWHESTELNQLASLEQLPDKALPNAPHTAPVWDNSMPKVILKNGKVHYETAVIFDNLTWSVLPNQHWHIVGENGAGKSTLLSLVTGDHPQSYANELTLFGIRRGSGETIWDIKRHIGYVSSSLHQSYRVRTTVKNVILSGYYDSIGVYEQPSEEIKALCISWSNFLGWTPEKMSMPFQSLSWGEQRLILIVRALVKHPALLILDEPFQGLDALNREWVKLWIERLVDGSQTQLLFVSHHSHDAPKIITHRMILSKGKAARFETVKNIE